MNTAERLRLLGPVLQRFPELGYAGTAALRAQVVAELGHGEILDRPVGHVGQTSQALAPALIYHVTAGNLAISAWQSLLLGLVLGSRNIIKPGEGTLAELQRFVRTLPTPLRRRVEIRTRFSLRDMQRADAVVVFGRDTTLRALQAQTLPGQIFIGHGQRVSAGWVPPMRRGLQGVARACAYDVAVYDQGGCLSPQAIFVPPGEAGRTFAGLLARELPRWCALLPEVERDSAAIAAVRSVRDVAAARGAEVWESEDPAAWTVILEKNRRLRLSCLQRTVHLYPAARAEEVVHSLRSWRGNISTLGMGRRPTTAERATLSGLGAVRFCPVGRMQHPAPGWHHDGRPSLVDLVRWSDTEPF